MAFNESAWLSSVGSKTAYEFMVNAMEQGKFRFALIHEWMAEHLVPLPG